MNDNTLKVLGHNIWVADYPFKLIGAEFGNRMTVIKYDSDKLLLHSPIPVSQTLMDELDSLGKTTILLAPNLMHNLFINDWKKHYPKSTLVAPKHIKNVAFDISLEEITTDTNKKLIPTEIQLEFIDGMKGLHEYALIHSPSKTLILTDLAFNICHVSGLWSKIFFKLYGAYGKFGPTRLLKAIIRDKSKFSASIQTIMNYEFDKIIVSHGDIVEKSGNTVFSNAFSQIK